jgi:CheY-like chemotaxis protein
VSSMARILMINDEADLLEVCGMILEGAGHSTESVAHANKPQLLQAVERFDPQLILLDLIMPVATGDEVSRWLRAHPRASTVPIVIMSALADAGARARHLGAQGFVGKPFTDEELIQVVEQTLRTQESVEVHP